jgi:hypothetical protein
MEKEIGTDRGREPLSVGVAWTLPTGTCADEARITLPSLRRAEVRHSQHFLNRVRFMMAHLIPLATKQATIRYIVSSLVSV